MDKVAIQTTSDTEIQSQLEEKQKQLMSLRFQASEGQLSRVHLISQTRKMIAKLLTQSARKPKN